MKRKDILTVVLAMTTVTSLGYGIKENLTVQRLLNDTATLNESIEKQKVDIELLKESISDLSQINESKDKKIEDKDKEIVDLKTELENRLKELEDARQRIAKINARVDFNHLNVLELSGATEVHMRRALKGTALECVADDFVLAEEEYGINAFFIAAIAAWESGWGTSDRAVYQNNLTGHAVYNSAAEGSSFSSWSKSISDTAKLLKNDYLTPGGISFNGYTVEAVNIKYCFEEDGKTVDYDWCRGIISIAYDLKNKANNF